MANISYYGSHNASMVVEDNGKIVCVIEVERFLNAKNMGLCAYKTPHWIMMAIEQIIKYIEREFGISEYENCYFASTDFVGENFEGEHVIFYTAEMFKAKNLIHGTHHLSHAYGALYQSPYEEALIFSFDAGGDDGKFNVYKGKRGEDLEILETAINPLIEIPTYYDLGFPYMIFGRFLKDIRDECLEEGNLVWPGKIMGLVSYGKVIEEWLPHFMGFYKSNPDGGSERYMIGLNPLGEKIGVKFDYNNQFEGELAYNIAATSQRAFEDSFLEVAKPWMDLYPELPICVAGGCGLNIILNTRLKEEFKKEVFVGPNPNDCGIALGNMLRHLKPGTPFDATYIGLPILDKNILGEYLMHYNNVKKLYKEPDPKFHPYEQNSDSILISDLLEGKIVGVVKGNSEHGPRALGNRSILCNPALPFMKDTLNAKVKNREWYRPFAPVVRLEDVSKYFEWEGESRWMSFCPKVKEEWREVLLAITHVDNTARVQTVTREQNEWLYDLLTELDSINGIGVLLNTSFNVNGKPILSTYKDAFEIFNNTALDCLLLENYYVRKEPFPKTK